MKKLITLIFILLFFISHVVHSQRPYDSTKISPAVLKIANKLTKAKRIEGVFIGLEGSISKIYATGKKLRQKASKDELIELTYHPNPIVRTYSFWGLAENKETGLLPIIIEHLSDTVSVKALFGDEMRNEKLCDFYINLVIPKYLFTADYIQTNRSILNDSERSVLDSVIVFTDNNLEYKRDVLISIAPKPGYYERIKQLSQIGNIYAIVALAKYRNESDIDLVKNSILLPKPVDSNFDPYFYTMMAISEFPHNDFWDFVRDRFDSIKTKTNDERRLRTLFEAMASFRRPECLNFLKSSNVYWDYYSFRAMTKYNSTLYDSLMFLIWKERKIITLSGLTYLLEIDKRKTLNQIITTLEDKNEFLMMPGLSLLFFSHHENTIRRMYDILADNDAQISEQLLLNKLKTAEYKELELYCGKAKEVRDSTIVVCILNRLSSDPEILKGDDYWSLMEVLVSYRDPDLESRMIVSILANETAIKEKKFSKKSLLEVIYYLKSAFSNPKTYDQLQIEKYR